MGRGYRAFVGYDYGVYHIISKVAGSGLIFGDEDKEYFVNLMIKLSRAYYVNLISYTVMSNHFHILLSNSDKEVRMATREELISKYKSGFGDNAEPPEGSYIKDSFEIDYDEDGGTERLRRRLGSVSRFVQDLKQRFSKWYNRQHDRKGYLWGERFKGIVISKGEHELICSAYIDLNAVRAGIVKRPEDYRWSSIGLRARNRVYAEKILDKIIINEEKVITRVDKKTGRVIQSVERKDKIVTHMFYASFVYESGRVEREGAARISGGNNDVFGEARGLLKRLGIGDSLRYRFRNLSEGIAFGSYKFISDLQEKLGRAFIKPREVLGKQEKQKDTKTQNILYSTRKLKQVKK
jgi:REP element-mobilizing transposase RayT